MWGYANRRKTLKTAGFGTRSIGSRKLPLKLKGGSPRGADLGCREQGEGERDDTVGNEFGLGQFKCACPDW